MILTSVNYVKMVFLLSSESLVHFWKLKLFSHSFPFSVWWQYRRITNVI